MARTTKKEKIKWLEEMIEDSREQMEKSVDCMKEYYEGRLSAYKNILEYIKDGLL